MSSEFDITVNGKTHTVAPGTTLANLVATLGRKPELVAVERNAEIVPRTQYADTSLAPGDTLEIVQFVQGGSIEPNPTRPLPSTTLTR